jgi:predicted Zn-dependent protease
MKSRQLALFFAVTLALGCGTSGRPKLNTISIEDEWQLGAQVARDLSQQLPLVNDADALTYLRNIGTRMVAQSNQASLPWEFHILRNDQVSAFTIPGGHVYVTTGLIKAVHNTSELAAAIAEQLGHEINRHAAQNLSKQYGENALAKAANGNDAAVYRQVVPQSMALTFTREQEKEADETALTLMDKANYDEKGLANFFRTVTASKNAGGFTASHPVDEGRIKDDDDKASKATKRATVITDEPEFHTIRERLQ